MNGNKILFKFYFLFLMLKLLAFLEVTTLNCEKKNRRLTTEVVKVVPRFTKFKFDI